MGSISMKIAPDWTAAFKEAVRIKTIGFIGAGKCGMSLAYYFRSKGINVRGFSSRSNDIEDFELFSCDELVKASDIIFITVTDTAIPEVWESISGMDLEGKIICNCSGSLSSEIFSGANHDMVCSVHPMLAFNSRHTSIDAVEQAFFTVEGGKYAVSSVSEILSLCNNKFRIINARDKAKYHAASCFASNFVVAVCDKAVRLLSECGFNETEARDALAPLMRNNMENIISCGAAGAITGPAARRDFVTIERHMDALDEKTAALYSALTDVILNETTAKRRDGNEKDNIIF